MTSEGEKTEKWLPDAQARGWLARLKSGEVTQHDLDMLAAWRAASDENEQSFRRAVRLWKDIGPVLAGGAVSRAVLPTQLPAAVHASAFGKAPSLPGMAMARRGVSRRWVLGSAGGLAAVAVAAMVTGGVSTPAGAKIFETRKGERQRLRLEPELSVDLNTNSRLLYWADALSPRLSLDRGEAIVTAACGEGRYLVAQMRDIELKAQTARFLLRSEEDVLKAACLQGRLVLRSGGKNYVLEQGMEMDFGQLAQPETARVDDADMVWQRDIIQFRDKPAGEVIEELNRYRPGRVYLLGDRASVRITGVIHLQSTDLAVDHIARSLGMKVTRLPGGIAILRGS